MYYFIINPHSRSGHGLSVWQKADAILKEKGMNTKLILQNIPDMQSSLQLTLQRKLLRFT